jgi:archaellum component FlaC
LALLVSAGMIIVILVLRRRPGEELARTLAGNLQTSLGDIGAKVGQLSAEVQGIARTQEVVRSEALQVREQGREALQQATEGLNDRIHQTQQALTSVTGLVHQTVRTQELLAQHLAQVQESLTGNLVTAQQGLSAEIAKTRELVAQVQAADQIREKHEQEAWDAVKRLETLLAGTKSRGTAGENILAAILGQLPPELRDSTCAWRRTWTPSSRGSSSSATPRPSRTCFP